ncbi:DUF4333 domain-containing protein [Mycolicibacterium flavescens]|uniref:DUF4333 domain-containing protein n=1 Tax=Mycolicibacterium flavescens TaxID=1776 RepID=A0A1E3RKF7_MYCFV|nr:DUF4333 domain-containing protein [Mycolicibacterium flavescens]MCV7281037.1 DUF4333 domain-containing protein [Mycolicibacterium flavescens]ODQ90338.1 hypothetical protein BHQ18_09735 [Mycolicibacterium flavescens]
MSGPQGSDPTQPYPGQQPDQAAGQPSGDPSGNQAWQPQGGDATQATPAWQPPAYDPQQAQQYPQYQQPAYQPPQQYPTGEQTYQQPAGYPPQPYQQPGQYTQPQYGQPYGQPPQYGQQPGQTGQYEQQPGQFGQYPQYNAPGSEESSKRSLKVIGGVIGALAAVIIAAVLVLGFWKPGFFVTTKLDIDAAQTGVQQILTDEANGYGAKNVQDVKCNDGQNPTVERGATFNCEVSIDGTKRQVTVTFQDDDGTYEVGRPK